MSDPSASIPWPHDTVRSDLEDAGNASTQAPFFWPTPPYAAYPQPTAQQAPEPCEILGLNNSRSSGHLIRFKQTERLVQIKVPPARAAMPSLKACGKRSSRACGTPRACRPASVRASCVHTPCSAPVPVGAWPSAVTGAVDNHASAWVG